jgi:hypothetical protein
MKRRGTGAATLDLSCGKSLYKSAAKSAAKSLRRISAKIVEDSEKLLAARTDGEDGGSSSSRSSNDLMTLGLLQVCECCECCEYFEICPFSHLQFPLAG